MFESVFQLNQNLIPYYLLMFVRMSGLFLISPIFSRRNVPTVFKVGLCLSITLVLATAVPPQADFAVYNLLGYTMTVLLELSLGMILGFISLFFFYVAQIAGQVIDVEIGMGMASVLDPQSGVQTSISGTMLNLLMVLYFLINNGHLRLIQILGQSVHRIPIGEVRLSPELAMFSAEQFTLAFSMAASLMLPLIGAALLTETAMGLLMRAIPQLNAYMVGIPLKVLIGLAALFFLQPFYIGFSDRLFERMFDASEQAFRYTGGTA